MPPGPVDTLSPSEEGDDEQFNEGFEESYPRSLALNTPEVRDLRRYLRALVSFLVVSALCYSVNKQ